MLTVPKPFQRSQENQASMLPLVPDRNSKIEKVLRDGETSGPFGKAGAQDHGSRLNGRASEFPFCIRHFVFTSERQRRSSSGVKSDHALCYFSAVASMEDVRNEPNCRQCQVDEGSAVLPVEAKCPRSFSRRTSPHPTRGTPAFAATAGEPSATDVGPLERDSVRGRARSKNVRRRIWPCREGVGVSLT